MLIIEKKFSNKIKNVYFNLRFFISDFFNIRRNLLNQKASIKNKQKNKETKSNSFKMNKNYFNDHRLHFANYVTK